MGPTLMDNLETTFPRGCLAVAAGVATGAMVVPIALLVLDFNATLRDPQTLVFVVLAGAAVWTAGLLVIALPAWVVLHRAGRRSWQVAIALGAVLTFVTTVLAITTNVSLYITAGLPTAGAWSSTGMTWRGGLWVLLSGLGCSSVGALVGHVVWRTAYRSRSVRE
jgi:hypothetical protein